MNATCLNRIHRAAPALMLAASVALGAGLLLAATTIPDAGGVIHGCYQDKKGSLRVVESASDCISPEVPIEWNQKGPKGDKGDKGDQGIQGIQGLQGPQGVKGDKEIPDRRAHPARPTHTSAVAAPSSPTASSRTLPR